MSDLCSADHFSESLDTDATAGGGLAGGGMGCTATCDSDESATWATFFRPKSSASRTTPTRRQVMCGPAAARAARLHGDVRQARVGDMGDLFSADEFGQSHDPGADSRSRRKYRAAARAYGAPWDAFEE